MQVPCDCMIVEQEDGSSMCRQCHGDWYGCDCPQRHSIRCVEHPDYRTDPDGLEYMIDAHEIMGIDLKSVGPTVYDYFENQETPEDIAYEGDREFETSPDYQHHCPGQTWPSPCPGCACMCHD